MSPRLSLQPVRRGDSGYARVVRGSKHFLTDDTFTVAGAYLFVVPGCSGHVGVDLAKWPNLKRFYGDLKTRPAVVSAMKAEGLSE
jgi:glutathione S-transferase